MEPGLGSKSFPTPVGFGGAGSCHQLVLMPQDREKDGQASTVDAPLVSKWVAIDEVSDLRASKTLINLSIPHLPPPHPSPTINGATEPNIEAAN